MVKTNQFINQLEKALVEKDVESIYRELLKMGIPDAVITSPHGGDGVLTSKSNNLIMLMEFKYDYDFQSRNDIAKVLIQSLYYLKKTELAGERLPSIVFIGDKNECFVLHTNTISKYLDENIDWTIAPSSAADKNPQLKLDLYADENIQPYVFDVDSKFDFSEVVNKILNLNNNVVRLVRITDKNINKIFEYFCDKVIPKTKLDANEKVGLFINTLTNPNENYIHPKKKNTLITPNGEITVRGGKWNSFFSHFESTYSPSEKEYLVEIADQLIVDLDRRMQGSFFTGRNVVDEAHLFMDNHFGDNWHNEYVVVDTSSGTGNLTKTRKFEELYSMTLIKDEHDIKTQNDVNPEATHTIHDFVNNGVGVDGFPKGLVEAIKSNKKIIFLHNPPYGTSANAGTGNDHKAGIAKSEVNEIMKADKIGACSQNLYSQFMYRIIKIKEDYELTDCHICQFSPTLYLTGGSYKHLRNKLLNNFSFEKGFVVRSDMFADTSSTWGILFGIMSSVDEPSINRMEFEIEVKEDVEDLSFLE